MQNTTYENSLIINDSYKEKLLSMYEKQFIEYVEENKPKYVYAKALVNVLYDNSSWKREALSEDNISLLLEYLSSKGVLSEKKNKILRVCHSCKSNVSILECQECGSKNIGEERKILHRCGYLDISSGFIYQDYLMCPLCGEAISFGDDVGRDYRFSDAVYKCEDCGSTVSKYDKLNENGACVDCGDINRYTKTELVSFYSIP